MIPTTPTPGLVAYPTAQACLKALFNQQIEARRQGRKPERARYYYNPASDTYHVGLSHRRWPRRRMHVPESSSRDDPGLYRARR
jgi:hypothetical protein